MCTRALAEARGQAIRNVLHAGGTDTGQIVGVKAWDNLDRKCTAAQSAFQRLDRNAWIFIASSSTR